MQPDERLARRVASDVFAGNKAGGRGVGDRKAGLELDELGAFVDGDDERGRDHGVLAGGDAAEVDQRHRELVRCDEGGVVGGRLKAQAGVGVFAARKRYVNRSVASSNSSS